MESIEKRFTLKHILYSPLYIMPEDLANLLYNIRQKKDMKGIEIYTFEEKPGEEPLKDNIRSQLLILNKKVNW